MAALHKMHFNFDLPGYEDACITVEYHITPYDPGVSHGPAEKCYPPEGGEVEICTLMVDGQDVQDILFEAIREKIEAYIVENHEPDDEPDWDYRRDQDRDLGYESRFE